MNILYCSTHTILEFDEISLFTELGHNVFSLGAYQIANADNGTRPAVPNLFQDDHLKGVSIQGSKDNIPQELIDWCDVVITMHNARLDILDHPQPWLAKNWEKFKKSGKPIVWRSIGQSTREIEKSLKQFRAEGLKIVRYSPKEDTIPDYQGCDALIRFYKDPDEYSGYTGENPRIVNVSQALFGNKDVRSRGDHMAIDTFKQSLEGLDWRVFGPDNEFAEDHNGGKLSFDDLKAMLRFNRVYFYTGTRPASYTLALLEAMITGIPIVSIGPGLGNAIYTEQSTFEVHEILGLEKDGGFWSDNVVELKEYCRLLLQDKQLAFEVGQRGRARAIELFGKQNIKPLWEEFLNNLKK